MYVQIPARARKLEEKDITASKDVLSSQTTAAAVQDGIGDLLLQAKRAYRKTRRALNGNDAAVYQVGVSGRRDIPSYTYGSSPSRTQEASPLGWLAVALAVGGIAIAVWQRRNSNGMFPFWGGLRGRQEGGRWIRDRSLGGKMIFIPDGSFSSSSASASSSSRPAPRPLWEDDDEFSSDLADAAAAATTSSAAVGTGTANDIPVRDTTPVWYAPPAPASYVSAERKQEMARQAKAALRDLEDAKILRGEDYSLSGMVTLRKACHLGGGLTVRASTESGRDAILRAAVRAGIEESLRSVNPATALGGYEPGRFVSGIASDLGVPEKRTITIVHAEVAATCRSSLIDAEAAYRARNESDLLRALRKMVLTLAAFPLPRGSAEAELVGRSLLKQATLEFRRAAFLGAGSADLATAPLVAEMLGFDPDLVMTELITKIAAAGTAVPGSEAAGP